MDDTNPPVEEGHDDATNDERIAGILEQTRADLKEGHLDEARDVLVQRFHDAGIEVAVNELERLVAEVRGG